MQLELAIFDAGGYLSLYSSKRARDRPSGGGTHTAKIRNLRPSPTNHFTLTRKSKRGISYVISLFHFFHNLPCMWSLLGFRTDCYSCVASIPPLLPFLTSSVPVGVCHPPCRPLSSSSIVFFLPMLNIGTITFLYVCI